MAGNQESGDATPNHLVVAQLSKTKMCIKYSKGSCKDSECRFAHSSEELREQPDLAKTAICRAFARGKCSNVDCKYAHGEAELRGSPTVYKTQLCNFFERGHCKKGDTCRHAHGKAELRNFPGSIPSLPQRKESPKMTTPKRGAKPSQAQVSSGSTSKAAGSSDGRSFSDAVYQTPQKLRKPVLERSNSGSPFEVIEPMKVLLPEDMAGALPFYGSPEALRNSWELSPFPSWPSHSPCPGAWPFQPPSQVPDGPVSESYARDAAIAAALEAHRHTMLANASASASMTYALMQQLGVSAGTPGQSSQDSTARISGTPPPVSIAAQTSGTPDIRGSKESAVELTAIQQPDADDDDNRWVV